MRRARGQPATARPGQRAQRSERVLHREERQAVHGRRAPPHDRCGGAFGFGLGEEVVGVEALALEGDEQGAGCQVSGIGGDTAEREIRRRPDPERLRYAVRGPEGHSAPSSRSTTRSSNGSFTVPITW